MHARIEFNALALRPSGSGVHTYIRELILGLSRILDADLVATVQADAVSELPSGVEPHVTPVAAGIRRAAFALRTPKSVDVVHGLDVAVPLRTSVPTVATIHDLSVFDVPWSFRRRQVMGKRLQLHHAARTATALIAVSDFTAERVRDRLARDSIVIPLAPAADYSPPSEAVVAAVRHRYELPESFVLHVGTTDPRKDVVLLGAACKIASLPLVLAGATQRSGGGLEHGVQRLGYVPRNDLVALYGAATIVAYPSRYEGFGLPPLEAMACGAPVVASRIPPLRDLLGDAAELVPPQDVEGLSAVLRELWMDPSRRSELSRRGLIHAGQFSWADTARRTAEIYRSLGVPV